MNPHLPTISSFTFGCMSLGWSSERMRSDIAVARAAMDGGVWFHASQEYAAGRAFAVMRQAFAESPQQRPDLILKIRCDSAALIAEDVDDALGRLGIERIAVAQLCRATHDRRPVVDDFIARGPMWQICERLAALGKVGTFVLEVFSSVSDDAIKAVKAGLFPGYIFYFSPGEREASQELFDLIVARQARVLALRTVYGGLLDPARMEQLRARDPGHAAIPRFDALRPIFERSGCASWPLFCMSFLKSLPNVCTTIAGTANIEHLKSLLAADRHARALPAALVAEITALHRRWSP
jgi:aryl-alcohol dehydrogenase-like predicted oxidoreductase